MAALSLFGTMSLHEVIEQVLLEAGERHHIIRAGSKVARAIRGSWQSAAADLNFCGENTGMEKKYFCDTGSHDCQYPPTYVCDPPFSCPSAYSVCVDPGNVDIFECETFECHHDYDCDANLDFQCREFTCTDNDENEDFDCGASHIFHCHETHECDDFDCVADGQVGCHDKPSKGYSHDEVGDFWCEGKEGGDAFDCEDFDCGGVEDFDEFDCDDHFHCNEDGGDGHFYCDQEIDKGFDCNEGADFDCGGNYSYCGM